MVKVQTSAVRSSMGHRSTSPARSIAVIASQVVGVGGNVLLATMLYKPQGLGASHLAH